MNRLRHATIAALIGLAVVASTAQAASALTSHFVVGQTNMVVAKRLRFLGVKAPHVTSRCELMTPTSFFCIVRETHLAPSDINEVTLDFNVDVEGGNLVWHPTGIQSST